MARILIVDDDIVVQATVRIMLDVTPRYVRTNAALETGTAGLAVALRFLLDASASTHGPSEPTGVIANRFTRSTREPVQAPMWES